MSKYTAIINEATKLEKKLPISEGSMYVPSTNVGSIPKEYKHRVNSDTLFTYFFRDSNSCPVLILVDKIRVRLYLDYQILYTWDYENLDSEMSSGELDKETQKLLSDGSTEVYSLIFGSMRYLANTLSDNKGNTTLDYKSYFGSVFVITPSAKVLEYNKIFNASQGHGFAAERANDLVDNITFNDASIIGDDFAKNGADRLVNGQYIQTKYCSTGKKCIDACFDSSGKFRYYSDNKPMQIEVPSDKYEAAIDEMKKAIFAGKVNGVKDPKEAENIIRRGHFTYNQAVNIAKAGTIESVMYDTATGLVTAGSTFGLTTLMSFAIAKWNGKSTEEALEIALLNALKVSGLVLIAHVITQQFGKTVVKEFFETGTGQVVELLGSKVSAQLINAYRGAGSSLSGAAAKGALTNVISSQVMASAVTFAVFTTYDILRAFNGEMSADQLEKNTQVAAAGIAASTAAGFAIGTVLPGIGNILGGVLGGIVGIITSIVTKGILDEFKEDDSKIMLKKLERVILKLCTDFMVSPEEMEDIKESIKSRVDEEFLIEMFKHGSSAEFYALYNLKDIFEKVTSNRTKIRNLEFNQLEVIKDTLTDKHSATNKTEVIEVKFEQNTLDDFEWWNEQVEKLPRAKEDNKRKVRGDIINKVADSAEVFNLTTYDGNPIDVNLIREVSNIVTKGPREYVVDKLDGLEKGLDKMSNELNKSRDAVADFEKSMENLFEDVKSWFSFLTS